MIVTKQSRGSVDETVARLTGAIADKRLKLFDVVDHSAAAAAVGLTLRDTKVVIFGSPTVGTPVMEAVPLVALDLPLKVLVWDDDGQTMLAYAPPGELAQRYGLSDDLAAGFAGIDAVTDAAAG